MSFTEDGVRNILTATESIFKKKINHSERKQLANFKKWGTFIKATVLFLNATWVDCIRKDASKLKQPGLKMMVAGWKYLHFPGGL